MTNTAGSVGTCSTRSTILIENKTKQVYENPTSTEILNCICRLFLYKSLLKIMKFSFDLNTKVFSVQKLIKFI